MDKRKYRTNPIYHKRVAIKDSYLTPREMDILKYVAMGKTYEEIAMILDICTSNIHHRIVNLSKKFNTTKITQLIFELCRHGLIEKLDNWEVK